MKRGRWFLPESPDVLGLLRQQLAVTIEGLDALAAWAGGDAASAEAVRAAEARGDTSKRELLNAIRDSFVTPVAAEDLFALSRGIDWILYYARDLIEEAEVMNCAPDAGIAEMAGLLSQAARKIDEAIGQLKSEPDRATAAADAAIEAQRKLEHVYYHGMADLLEINDMRERISRRELYRRCSHIGELVIDVAERIVYAVVKESWNRAWAYRGEIDSAVQSCTDAATGLGEAGAAGLTAACTTGPRSSSRALLGNVPIRLTDARSVVARDGSGPRYLTRGPLTRPFRLFGTGEDSTCGGHHSSIKLSGERAAEDRSALTVVLLAVGEGSVAV